jgi:hypothetical protein
VWKNGVERGRERGGECCERVSSLCEQPRLASRERG